jgi:hypothetical protein
VLPTAAPLNVSHEIFRVVQPALAFLVGSTQPAFADHGHQHVARAHPLFDGFYEVDARMEKIVRLARNSQGQPPA